MEQLPKTLNNVSQLVKQSLKSHFTGVCQQFDGVKIPDVKLQAALGNKEIHYQSPSMMQVFNMNKKHLGKNFKNVDEFTQKIVTDFKPDNTISKIEAAQGSFLNIFLQDSFIEAQVSLLLRIGTVHPVTEKPSTVAVDFSSPNIAKEMHVGHLRSTIIGESVCRILEYTGNKVHRINHVGDWGTQFGMLILHMKETFPDYMNNMPNLTDLTQFYKEAKKRFDEDEDFKKQAQLTVVKLQSGDEECIKSWKVICDVSRQMFNSIYKRLDINVQEFGESYYNKELPKVVAELEEKKLIEIDDGAKVVRLPKYKIPVIVQKRDGGYNYSSTDLAAWKHRYFNLNCNRMIYITDGGQNQHFQMIFKTVELIKWADPKAYNVEHAWFGVVQGEDGGKFKTRSGDTVKLVDLLDEAKERAHKQILERSQQNDLPEEEKVNTGTKISESEYEEAAEAMGIAAIKYFDLRQNRQSDYKFSYDRMLDTKGNTAVYLLYAYARINSIIRKSGWSEEEIQKKRQEVAWKITHDHERYTAVQLIKFTELIQELNDNLKTNLLTEYIYDIASKISEGYKLYRILGEKETETRVLLCIAMQVILKQGLFLVGIKPLEKI